MNQIDIDYQNLVRDILENGHKKNDRTGTGTISVFGRTIRHFMKDGFPLLTTKKMAWKTMVTELLFFLRGETNLRFLVDRNCHIWDGDAWKHFSTVRESMLMLKPPASEVKLREYIEWYEQITTKEQFINKIKTDDEFAKKWGELGPIYPKQWRRWKKPIGIGYSGSITMDGTRTMNEPMIAYDTVDQIANVINLLKTDPDSRRMIVSAWNVGELDQMVLPPCHMMFQFYTRELSFNARYRIGKYQPYSIEGKVEYESGLDYITEDQFENFHNEEMDKLNIPTRAISLRWDQRSNDIGLGSPMNISSYSLLLMIIAKQVNMVPEEIIGHLGDCHIYNNHVDGLKEQLTRIPYDLPTVKISDRIVSDISEYTVEDFTLENYVSHSKIYLPLSN